MSRTRTPAPLRLVTGPVGMVVRARRKGRAAAAEEQRIERAVARRLPDAPTVEEPTEKASTARGWLYRHRRDTVGPVAFGVGLAVARTLVGAIPVGPLPGYTSVAVVALAVAFAGAAWVRRVDPVEVADPAAAKRAQAVSLVVVAALAWLLWQDSWRIPTGVPGHVWRWALLAGVTAVVCVVRYRWFRPRPEVFVITDLGPAEKWAETVGSKGPLAGTYLREVTRVISQAGEDVGWRAEVVCMWGEHDATKVANQRELIAGAFGRDLIDFTAERTGNALVARMILTERDPFPRQVTPKTWLNDDGTFVVGSYADGSDCRMRFFTPGHGIHDFWFFGAKGSGKSTLVDNALGSIMSRGWVVLHLTDLKGGMSLPEWREIAFRYGKEAADGLMQLRRLDAIGTDRMAECERNGWKLLPINAEWPVHLGLTEEAPQLWRIKEAVLVAERIKTLYRAVNVSLMDISQMAQLAQAWGNSNTLRVQAQAGNVGCGYVTSDEADLGFDHFNPDMSLIQKGSYHWYVTSPVESREVLVKVAQVDSAEVARKAIPGTPNPVDLAAVERVEREEAERQARLAAEDAGEVKPGTATREDVEAAVKRLCRATAGPVATGDVVKALGDPKDETHYERVRKALKALGEDPASRVQSPAWGKWAA